MLTIRGSSASARASAVTAWAGLATTITATVLYVVSIARGVTLADQLKAVCARGGLGERTRPGDSIETYFLPVMFLAAVGLVATVVALTSSRRKFVRVAALVTAIVATILFLLAWYGFAHRSDDIGPFCGG